MKQVLLATCLLISSMGFGQSNKEGTVSFGAGFSILAQGSTLDQTQHVGSSSLTGTFNQQTGFGIGETFGIRGQYGINKIFGVGAYARVESKFVATSYDNTYTSNTTDISSIGVGIGLEGRVYLINHKKFNFHAAPALGYEMASTTVTDDNLNDFNGSLSGLNYGLTGGMNWFFINLSSFAFGMSADIGYNHSSLSGKYANSLGDVDQKLSTGGFVIGIGVTAHL